MIRLADGALFNVGDDEVPWEASQLTRGLAVKNIAIAGGMELQLVRMEPGAVIPPHTHALPEFLYVLDGELEIGGQRLARGGASVAAPGSRHVDVRSPSGCTFVLVDQPL